MAETVTMERLYDELKNVNKRLDSIERQIKVEIMTPEEERLIEEAIEAVDNGTAKTLDEIEKERGD